MDQHTEQRIRQLAYELWIASDKPEGSHLRFWKEAEILVAAMDKVELSSAKVSGSQDQP